LLAMANDASSPNEAAIAARRARKLMDQEGLTQAEVERMGSGGATFAAMGSGKAKRFMPKWEQSLAVGVASLNDCIVRWMGAWYNSPLVDLQIQENSYVNQYKRNYLRS